MSSYHLPIVVGQNQSERIVIIHLVDDKESYEENRIVIVSPNARNTPLFRVSDQAQLIDIGGNLLRPQFDRGNNLVNVYVDGRQISPRRSNGFWSYFIRSDEFDDVVAFSVTISVNGSDVNYKGSLHIVRPTIGEMVMNLNADLGSDATQINYYIPGTGVVGSQKINLVKCFENAYKPDRNYDSLVRPASREPLFIQQEKGSRDFYKTGNITFHIGGDINASIKESGTFINYINVSAAGKNEPDNATKKANTWDKEDAFNRKLINIKMLYAHSDIPEVCNAVDDIEYVDKTILKDVMNPQYLLQVLQAIYKQLITISTGGVANNCRLFSILLLVPNIYIQQNIDLLLYEMSKMNKNDDGRKYDFRIISESDSAFVGIKEARTTGNQNILGNLLNNIKDPRQRDTFLIIDAGKGTTDFSIVRYDCNPNSAANSNLISLRRDGIVGAGGAIDYVFARVFARQIYKHQKEIVSPGYTVTESVFIYRFMSLIERLKPVDQDRLMLIVEMLKKNYKDGRTARVYTCFAGSNARTVVDFLLGENASDDRFKQIVAKDAAWKEIAQWGWDNQTIDVDSKDTEEVDWVCQAIAKTIIDDMIFDKKDNSLNRQIDYVIFNGRSFLFEPLKKAFVDAIEPNRGIWYENHGFSVYAKRLKPKAGYYNLKIAPLNGFNMKSVSVQFEDHDLGVNCNSDLCCVDGITFEEGMLDQNQFWHGFDVSDDDKLHYYIGYVCEDKNGNNKVCSFVPEISQGVTAISISDTCEKLVFMTLFPVSYVPVFDDTAGAPASTQSGVPPVAPPPASPTAGPSTPTPPVRPNGTDDNSLTIPSGNHSNPPVNNNDRLDINDL